MTGHCQPPPCPSVAPSRPLVAGTFAQGATEPVDDPSLASGACSALATALVGDLTGPGREARETRIALLLLAADALAAGEPVPEAISRWLGTSMRRWLDGDGDLDSLLQVRAPRGSHETVRVLARRVAESEGLPVITTST